MTSKVIYTGDLRTRCLHLGSGSDFITDAPTDNYGLGQAFSPTDTVATAVASCMLTVMGIKARDLGADLRNTTAEVTKFMAADPRRISKVKVRLLLPADISEKDRKILEHAGRHCPVILSLHDSIEKELDFNWVL